MINNDTKILKIDDNSLDIAKNLILNEELVAFPTETVYGLGALATSNDAVLKTLSVKGRPQDNPLIVHVHENYDLSTLVEIENDYVYDLIKAFMPGPLTLVLKSKGNVSPFVTCGLDTVAVRMPSHEGCQKFLKYLDLPISAPSANISKHTSPVTANHVYEDFNGKIKLILDGGKCSGGIESTVLDVTCETPEILRAGLITFEMIEAVVGKCKTAVYKEGEKAKSPGVMYTHYRPRTKTALFNCKEVDKALILYEEYLNKGETPYVLCEEKVAERLIGKNLLNLGKTPEEMASNLYYMLREGEEVADIIIAIEPDGNNGIYDGILNRLRRACI